MATEYHPADEQVIDLLAEVLEGYFPELHRMEPTLNIDVKFAVSDKPGIAALRRHRHPCAATIEVVKPEERSSGGPDVRLKIDKVRWLDMGEDSQRALLHHELSHCMPIREKDGGHVKLDPYGRPVVKMRPDDWMLTGFRETVRIFGKAAVERQSLDRVEEILSQRDFGFMASDPVREAARDMVDAAGRIGADAIEFSIPGRETISLRAGMASASAN